MQLFSLFLNDQIIDEIVVFTNRNAELLRRAAATSGQKSSKHRRRPWVPCTRGEMYAYFATMIHMGLHLEPSIADYWKKYGNSVEHHVAEYISRTRWQQIDRYVYLTRPREPGESPFQNTFQRVEDLAERICKTSQQYWTPGQHLAVDESIQRFTGRSKEITTIKCKAAGTGYKIWILADAGFVLDLRFHSKGSTKSCGPYKLNSCWRKEGFSATASVVLDLCIRNPNDPFLPPNRHCIWLDNLFTTIPLLERLRKANIGAAGTVRTTKTPREETEERQAAKKRRGKPMSQRAKLGRRAYKNRLDSQQNLSQESS
jgi:hypothetical protein